MGKLVIGYPIESFVCGSSFKHVLVRLDSQLDVIVRNADRPGVTVVVKVFQQDDYFLGGRIVEEVHVEPQGVLEASRKMGQHVRVRLVVVEDLRVLRFDLMELSKEGRCEDEAEELKERNSQQGKPMTMWLPMEHGGNSGFGPLRSLISRTTRERLPYGNEQKPMSQ